MFGVLNINKPKGCTSHDVVARLRKLFKFKKIGHLGTLDPMAEGVLPVCFGQATRLIEYFPDDKGYRAWITLGVTTDTLDIEGEVQEERDASQITTAQMLQALESFRGTIEQQVPLYSAAHHQGKKLYHIARSASADTIAQIELPTKTVTIYRLDLLAVESQDSPHPVLTLDIDCSSGTYVRSLARDLGQALGCGAHLSGLIRTRHGHFNVETAISLDAIAEATRPVIPENPAEYLSIPTGLVSAPDAAVALRHGMAIPTGQIQHLPAQVPLAYLTEADGRPLAVVQLGLNRAQPVKVFNTQA